MKTLKLKSHWTEEEYNIGFRIEEYQNGNTAILMECYTDTGAYDGSFDVLTVNLGDQLIPGCGYVNVNHLGDEIMEWIEENELGMDTGIREKTVFVTYPLYEFDLDKIKEYSRP